MDVLTSLITCPEVRWISENDCVLMNSPAVTPHAAVFPEVFPLEQISMAPGNWTLLVPFSLS